MRIQHKIYLIILFPVYSIFLSQLMFAQDSGTAKTEIYSKLRDRRCTTMTILECNCPDAREMRAYIDALIEAGISKEDVFYKVAKKFSLNTILDVRIKKDVEKRLIKEIGVKRPQVILEPASFDFGQVSKRKGKISKVFKFANHGNTPLIITNIKTSCPCVTTSLKLNKKKTPYFGTEGAFKDWQIEIKPQETGELELLIDLSSQHVKPGKLIREVTIFSSDPVYPEVTVKIEAEVLDK